MTGPSSPEMLVNTLLTDLEYNRPARIPAGSGPGERITLLLLNMNFGNMTHPEAMRSLRLFGEEVLPAFR